MRRGESRGDLQKSVGGRVKARARRASERFGWVVRFPLVLAITLWLKAKNRALNTESGYAWHQQQFYRHRLLEDGSDKFDKVREKIARYAAGGAARRALDIATGHGGQAKALKEHGVEEVVGIDLVPERIEVCRRRWQGAGIRFRVMDACSLRFPSNHFDCVTVSAALHDMPAPVRRKAISEMARVARKRVVIFEPRNFRNPVIANLYGILGGLLDESLSFRDYVKEDMGAVLESCGLRVVRQETAWHGLMSIIVCEVAGRSRHARSRHAGLLQE